MSMPIGLRCSGTDQTGDDCFACEDCTIAHDEFERDDNTNISTDSEFGWTETGSIEVKDHELQFNTSNSIAICDTPAETNTKQVRASADFTPKAVGDVCKLIIKRKDASNYWYAAIIAGPNGKLKIFKRVAGVETELNRVNAVVTVDDDPIKSYTLSVCYGEGLFSASMPGGVNTSIADPTNITDAQYSAVGVGNIYGANVLVDNFKYEYGQNKAGPKHTSCPECGADQKPCLICNRLLPLSAEDTTDPSYEFLVQRNCLWEQHSGAWTWNGTYWRTTDANAVMLTPRQTADSKHFLQLYTATVLDNAYIGNTARAYIGWKDADNTLIAEYTYRGLVTTIPDVGATANIAHGCFRILSRIAGVETELSRVDCTGLPRSSVAVNADQSVNFWLFMNGGENKFAAQVGKWVTVGAPTPGTYWEPHADLVSYIDCGETSPFGLQCAIGTGSLSSGGFQIISADVNHYPHNPDYRLCQFYRDDGTFHPGIDTVTNIVEESCSDLIISGTWQKTFSFGSPIGYYVGESNSWLQYMGAHPALNPFAVNGRYRQTIGFAEPFGTSGQHIKGMQGRIGFGMNGGAAQNYVEAEFTGYNSTTGDPDYPNKIGFGKARIAINGGVVATSDEVRLFFSGAATDIEVCVNEGYARVTEPNAGTLLIYPVSVSTLAPYWGLGTGVAANSTYPTRNVQFGSNYTVQQGEDFGIVNQFFDAGGTAGPFERLYMPVAFRPYKSDRIELIPGCEDGRYASPYIKLTLAGLCTGINGVYVLTNIFNITGGVMPGGGDQWRLVKQITTPDITIEGFPVKGGPGFIYINLLPSGDDLTLKLTYHYTGYGGVLGFSAAIGVGCQETVNYRINAIGGADILCPPFLPITLNVVSATTGNHLDPATYGLRYQDGGNGYAVPGTNPDSGDPSVMEHCPGAETSTATIESF